MNSPNGRRVVVTGMGAISPLGVNVPSLWHGLVNCHSGVGPITQFDACRFECRIAGEATEFDPKEYLPRKAVRRMARCSQMAVAAAREAAAQSELADSRIDAERVGVLIGTAMGGWEMADEGTQQFRRNASSRGNPFALPASIPNMPSHHVSRDLQALGPMLTICTACATGSQAIGEAGEIIRRGAADVMVTGGVEALIRDFCIAGFSGMRALPTGFNNSPERASRPFDRDREGFVFSEGCGVLVLESLKHARGRGAEILAEVLGHAASADAFHIAQPNPQASGAIRAMRWALDDACVNTDEIDYINAHGTGTLANDPLETLAIKTLFGERAYSLPVSATKSMLGHPLGASGALEAIACIMSIRTGVLHPTRNLDNPDPACDLDYVPHSARSAQVHTVLTNSFGLGGQNAALVLREFNH
ncbi:MAG TPA: beta-ketoacyl-ACP synthase II [Anaerolineales bacterium]|jgi:beta-ketoacyl-acyl-carrier-protein synthase II|nr:beta-ketoacyl-ACP synthase II [Anaerolineales bacterium]|tara:strand:- start:535 stop:1791 length:1257 start_codon:yes stop_codon:yes gene_type:complete